MFRGVTVNSPYLRLVSSLGRAYHRVEKKWNRKVSPRRGLICLWESIYIDSAVKIFHPVWFFLGAWTRAKWCVQNDPRQMAKSLSANVDGSEITTPTSWYGFYISHSFQGFIHHPKKAGGEISPDFWTNHQQCHPTMAEDSLWARMSTSPAPTTLPTMHDQVGNLGVVGFLFRGCSGGNPKDSYEEDCRTLGNMTKDEGKHHPHL